MEKRQSKSRLRIGLYNCFPIDSLVIRQRTKIPEDNPDNGSTVIGITDAIGDTPLKDASSLFLHRKCLRRYNYYPTMQSLELDRMLMEWILAFILPAFLLPIPKNQVPTRQPYRPLKIISLVTVKSIDNGDYPHPPIACYEVKEVKVPQNHDLKKGMSVESPIQAAELTLSPPRSADPLASIAEKLQQGDDQSKASSEGGKSNKGTDTRVPQEEFVTAMAIPVLISRCNLLKVIMTFACGWLHHWCNTTDNRHHRHHWLLQEYQDIG